MNRMLHDLRVDLLARLDEFAAPRGITGEQRLARRLFCYCALERERLASIRPEGGLLGVVLRGKKEVWYGAFSEMLGPGAVFALPRGLPMDVVNIPDDRGRYISLVLQIDRLPAGIAPQPAPRRIDRVSVGLTPDLVEAIAHTAAAIRSPQSQRVGLLRLTELLTLLADDPAGRLILAGDVAERARWLIGSDPARNWQVGDLAREMGMGASSLRRALGNLGQPFRSLLAEARMQAARKVLDEGKDVATATEAAGYRSRSHFTRAYRRAFSVTPGGRIRDGA